MRYSAARRHAHYQPHSAPDPLETIEGTIKARSFAVPGCWIQQVVQPPNETIKRAVAELGAHQPPRNRPFDGPSHGDQPLIRHELAAEEPDGEGEEEDADCAEDHVVHVGTDRTELHHVDPGAHHPAQHHILQRPDRERRREEV